MNNKLTKGTYQSYGNSNNKLTKIPSIEHSYNMMTTNTPIKISKPKKVLRINSIAVFPLQIVPFQKEFQH